MTPREEKERSSPAGLVIVLVVGALSLLCCLGTAGALLFGFSGF